MVSLSDKANLGAGVVMVPVGSRVTCNPPPTDTDEDYLILTPNRVETVAALKAIGFEYSADPKKVEEYERLGETSLWSFTSLWFGDLNYIITESAFFFERFLTATHVCKTLNLLKKEDRIMVFDAIRGVSFSSKMAPDWRYPGKSVAALGDSGQRAGIAVMLDLADNVSGIMGADAQNIDSVF